MSAVFSPRPPQPSLPSERSIYIFLNYTLYKHGLIYQTPQWNFFFGGYVPYFFLIQAALLSASAICFLGG